MRDIPAGLYEEAVAFTASRDEFSGERFQRVLRVGWVMSIRLLAELVHNGVIERGGRDRYRRLT